MKKHSFLLCSPNLLFESGIQMHIAVLPPLADATHSSIENYLQLQALKTLLADHELTVLSSSTAEMFDWVITLGDRVLTDGFWDEWILGKPAKVLALNLALDADRTWDSRSIEKLRAIGKQGGVSLSDDASFKKAREILGPSAVSLGGNPALFTSESSFVFAESSRIFCPTVKDPAFTGRAQATLRRLQRRFYRRMNHKGRALFLVQDPREFEFGALVGGNTLYEPHHPQLHLKALASASSVVGFHPTPLIAAVACGVPAVLIGNDPFHKNAIESAGIPFLEINPNTDPAELDHRAEEIIRKYPWETIQEKSGRLRNSFIDHLKELGIKHRETKRRSASKSVSSSQRITHIGTILGRDDLPAFAGLFENLISVNGVSTEVHHHVLALDRSTELAIQKAFPTQHVYLYRSSEIWEDNDLTPLLAPVDRRKFLMKPRFLSVLLKKTGEPVFYADSSLFFYRDPVELLRSLDGGHTLFFPRWDDKLAEPLVPSPFDTSLLIVGPGSEPLLEWWTETASCALDQAPASGLQGEPGFLGLATILFPGVRVYRAADHNVAALCAEALGVHSAPWPGEALRLADERSVTSLRWQGEEPSASFGIKVVWDQLVHFFAALPKLSSRHRLSLAIRQQQKTHWEDLRQFLVAYRLFLECFPWLDAEPRPGLQAFFVSGPGRYFLRRMGEVGRVAHSPRSMSLVGSVERAWTAQLQDRIFAPFRPPAVRAESDPVRPASVSA